MPNVELEMIELSTSKLAAAARSFFRIAGHFFRDHLAHAGDRVASTIAA